MQFVRTDRALNRSDSSNENDVVLLLPKNIGPSSNSLMFTTVSWFTEKNISDKN